MKTLLHASFILALAVFIMLQKIAAQTNTFPSTGSAGIGTTTPNASALLEMKSTTQGILIPRMTLVQRNAIASPAKGLMIYQTNNTPGFYYYNGTAWTAVSTVSQWTTSGSNIYYTTGNAGIGTKTPGYPLDVSGDINQSSGNVLHINGAPVLNVNPGTRNVGIGEYANGSVTTGVYNTSIGNHALYYNTAGISNIAIGSQTMYLNTTGNTNTAVGSSALFSNTTGYNNVAIGVAALYSTTGDFEEIAIGDSAMYHMNANQVPDVDIAIGSKALYNETGSSRSGYENTAVGYQSLYTQNGGYFNAALGDDAGFSNTIGNGNTAIGEAAMYSNSSGSYNTIIGSSAGFTNTTGNDNTTVGFAADANANNHSDASAFGSGALSTASDQVRIGDGSVTSIGGYAGWTNISDGRVKKNIQRNVPGLAFINQLKPVTYNLDLDAADKIVQPAVIKDRDGKPIQPSQQELTARTAKEEIVYTGFIAQDVQQAAQSINYSFSGVDPAKNSKDLYGLRYAEFVVPLVKAVQELSAANDSKQNQIDSLKSANAALNSRLTKIETVLKLNQSSASYP